MSKKSPLFSLFTFLKSTPFLLLTFLGNAFLLLAVTAVFFLERNTHGKMQSFLDALWWGVTTITTVGYGDIVPLSVPGRIIGLVLMYTGTVLFIAFTSLIAAYWVRTEVSAEMSPVEQELRRELSETKQIEKTLQEIIQRLDRLEKKS